MARRPQAVEFATFGEGGPFTVSLRRRVQRDRAERWPAGYGWSLGDMRLSIGGRVLTENLRNGRRQDHVSWYLLPVVEWLADHWVELLHEEEFGWQEGSSAHAAVVVPRVLAESGGKDDDAAAARYEMAQGWRDRHGLRAAAHGGLLPDLYMRRFLDSVELSWTDAPPVFAPDGFRFVSRPGYAACTVDEVATPLWEAINFVADGGIGVPGNDADAARFAALADRIAAIRAMTVVDFARARVAPLLLAAAGEALGARRDALFRSERVADDIPAIAAFSPALAMYGGLSADIGIDDVGVLARLAVAADGAGETPELAALVADKGGAPRRAPPVEGHALAEDLVEDLGLGRGAGPVDVRALLAGLGIEVVEAALRTDTVRGVALAGQGMRPTILVNLTSFFNDTEAGRRFTLAHEFGHILYDRGAARRVGISSGPWAPAAVEKRANAFAAMLLMPRARVRAAFADDYADSDAVDRAADLLQVSRRALVDHLFNIYLIDENTRERLRARPH